MRNSLKLDLGAPLLQVIQMGLSLHLIPKEEFAALLENRDFAGKRLATPTLVAVKE
jgi:hypothetical protein